MVLYMSFSFWLLGVESRDFPHAEKERTACKAEQSHKMSTIFTQYVNLGPPGFDGAEILKCVQS